MGSDRRWGEVGIHLGNGIAVLIAAWLISPDTGLEISMVVFGGFVLVVHWFETLRLLRRASIGSRRPWILTALTLAFLAVWILLISRPADQLSLYFLALAGLFVIVSGRDTIVLSATPIHLLMGGHVTLIAVCVFASLIANAYEAFDLPILMIVAFVYLVRKAYTWTASVLGWLRQTSESRA